MHAFDSYRNQRLWMDDLERYSRTLLHKLCVFIGAQNGLVWSFKVTYFRVGGYRTLGRPHNDGRDIDRRPGSSSRAAIAGCIRHSRVGLAAVNGCTVSIALGYTGALSDRAAMSLL